MSEKILLKHCVLIDLETAEEYQRDILIADRCIQDVAVDLPNSAAALVMDVRENYVLPGFIDCHTHLGIIEEGIGKIGVDNNETSDPVTPNLRGIDAVNPQDIGFKDAYQSGITTVMSGPGSDNVVGGQSLALKTYGRIIDQIVIKNPVGLKVALGENPITTYGPNRDSPVTRMGTAALIRELFWRTQDYMALKEEGELRWRELKLEAVIPALTGEIPLRVHAHRADDIVTAIRLADEFGINKLVIEHGTEADLVKEYLQEKK